MHIECTQSTPTRMRSYRALIILLLFRLIFVKTLKSLNCFKCFSELVIASDSVAIAAKSALIQCYCWSQQSSYLSISVIFNYLMPLSLSLIPFRLIIAFIIRFMSNLRHFSVNSANSCQTLWYDLLSKSLSQQKRYSLLGTYHSIRVWIT